MTSEGSVAQALADDHARIDGLLRELLLRLGGSELGPARDLFADLCGSLVRHIRIEEETLFPALARNHSFVPPCLRMQAEHRKIESELAAIDGALVQGIAGEAATALERLNALLAEHNLKEERVLYPRADAALSTEQRARLTERLR